MNDNKFTNRTDKSNGNFKPPTFSPAQISRSPRKISSFDKAIRRSVDSSSDIVEATNARTTSKQPQNYQKLDYKTARDSQARRGNEPVAKLGKNRNKSRKFILRRIKRIIGLVLVVLLLFVGAIAYWLIDTYSTLKSSIIRTDALSMMKDNSAASTFLIVGNDGRSAEAQSDVEGARADTIMLLIHTATKDSLISIPRDTMVELPPFIDKNGIFAHPGEEVEEVWAKINAAYSYGSAKLLVETVEDLVGLKIDHYAEVGFDGIAQLTDALGGINLCYDQEVNDHDSGMVWTPGCKDVNGAEALAYSRMRHQDPLSDIGRMLRQRTVVQKLAAKSTELVTSGNLGNLWNIFKLKEVAKSALGTLTFDENTSITDMYKFITYFKSATSPSGYMDTIPIEDADYYNSVLGSVIKVDKDDVKNFIIELTKT
ncbi:MAG: LCP family protein [Candidatus Ancillula sp.]|jgi:LCP family protein required for cell wall assembly|nr:LCP family protein [Candidatus Ancillula sp.]